MGGAAEDDGWWADVGIEPTASTGILRRLAPLSRGFTHSPGVDVDDRPVLGVGMVSALRRSLFLRLAPGYIEGLRGARQIVLVDVPVGTQSGRHVSVPEVLLHNPRIGPAAQHVGRHGVPQGVHVDRRQLALEEELAQAVGEAIGLDVAADRRLVVPGAAFQEELGRDLALVLLEGVEVKAGRVISR